MQKPKAMYRIIPIASRIKCNVIEVIRAGPFFFELAGKAAYATKTNPWGPMYGTDGPSQLCSAAFLSY
jgi:hypothetical protein